jgi:DNA-binding transcriptional ArsR family regulator
MKKQTNSGNFRKRSEGRTNMIKVFMTIAKKPMSFSELLKETRLSKPVLTDHLRHLEKNLAVYREVIGFDQTPDPKEVGKVVYRPKLDQIPTMLKRSLPVLDVILDVLEDEKLRKELEPHIQAIGNAIIDYLNDHNKRREQGLELDRQFLKSSRGTRNED